MVDELIAGAAFINPNSFSFICLNLSELINSDWLMKLKFPVVCFNPAFISEINDWRHSIKN